MVSPSRKLKLHCLLVLSHSFSWIYAFCRSKLLKHTSPDLLLSVFAFEFRLARDKNSSSTFNCSYASAVLNKIWIHLQFADSAYILRNPLTVAESRTTGYICLLRNPQQNKCADKIYLTGICMRNPLKTCLRNLLTLWNKFWDLSLEFRTI